MVRSPRFVSVAIRASQGRCIVETRPLPSVLLARRWLRAPFVRGVAVLAEGLWIGTWALTTSARAATSDQAPLSAGRIRLILVRSLTISIALFFLLPTVLARLVAGGGMPPLGQNALEGAIRIALVLAFLLLNPVFYSFYANTAKHPRFLYASLPFLFVLWAGSVDTIRRCVARL